MPKQLSTPSLGTHSNPHRIRSVGWNNIHLMSHGQTPYVVSGWPIYPQLKIVSKSLLKPVLSTTLEIWTMTHTHTSIHRHHESDTFHTAISQTPQASNRPLHLGAGPPEVIRVMSPGHSGLRLRSNLCSEKKSLAIQLLAARCIATSSKDATSNKAPYH